MNQNKIRILSICLFLISTLQVFSQGKVIIQSDDTGTGSLIVGTENAMLQIEANRYIPSEKWHIISSPVSDQQLGLFVSDANNDIKYNSTYDDYDIAPYSEELNNWSPYTKSDDTNLMGEGMGYSTRRASVGTVTYTGEVNSGVINVAVTKNNFGWNAIGNPYTSPLRIKGTNSFLEDNTAALDESYAGIYVWDQSLSDYQVIAESGFSFPAPGGEIELEQNFVDLGQGFIIKAKETGTVSFTPLMQDHDTVSIPFKSGEISWPAMRLTASFQNSENRTVIAFNDKMTLGLDPSYDMGKFKGNPNLALYTRLLNDNGVDFVTQCLPLTGYESYRIPIGLDCNQAGEVLFSLEKVNLPSDMQVYIEDVATNSITRIDNSKNGYTVSLGNVQKGIGRFYIITSNKLLTSAKVNESSGLIIFERNQKLIVQGDFQAKAKIRMCGIDGRVFHLNHISEQSVYEIDATGFPAGVYIVQVENKGKTLSTKLVITGR